MGTEQSVFPRESNRIDRIPLSQSHIQRVGLVGALSAAAGSPGRPPFLYLFFVFLFSTGHDRWKWPHARGKDFRFYFIARSRAARRRRTYVRVLVDYPIETRDFVSQARGDRAMGSSCNSIISIIIQRRSSTVVRVWGPSICIHPSCRWARRRGRGHPSVVSVVERGAVGC